MKFRSSLLIILLLATCSFYSCKKQEYFKSEKTIKKELQGTWTLIAIPKYIVVKDSAGNIIQSTEHIEKWTFNDTRVSIDIIHSGESGSSEYTVHTSWTKAEVKLEGVTSPLVGSHYNGTWQIVTLDDQILSIANDHDGATGLTQLEFKKQN